MDKKATAGVSTREKVVSGHDQESKKSEKPLHPPLWESTNRTITLNDGKTDKCEMAKSEISANDAAKQGICVNYKIEQNIVIALDGSEQSLTAVNWYVERLHREGNRVILAHVIELPEPKLNEAKTLHMSPGVLATMWKEEESRVKELERKMKNVLNEKGIKGVLRTATGKPGEVLCRIAEEENAAMMLVGTRGMNRVRRTILGSVSDFLVNHAFCPVVVCRAKHRKYSGTDRTRNPSGESSRQRHFSGENLRKLFSFGSKSSRSLSTSSEPDPLQLAAGAAASAAATGKNGGTGFKEEDEHA